MPQSPNRLLRIVVPIVLLAGGVLLARAVYVNSVNQGNKSGTNAPSPGAAQQSAPQPTAPATAAPTIPVDPTGSTPPVTPPGAQIDPATGQPVVTTPADGQVSPPTTPPGTLPATIPSNQMDVAFISGPPAALTPIGSLDPATDYELYIRFSTLGAGIESLKLTDHYTTISQTDHEELQNFQPHPAMPRFGIAPFGLDGIEVNGKFFRLYGDSGREGTCWTELSTPGSFQATINDAAGKPALTITRSYELEKNSYDIKLKQTVQNLTDQPVKVVWHQYGPSDLPKGLIRYGGDRRRVRLGYLTDPQLDPTQQIVEAKKYVLDRPTVLGSPTGMSGSLRTWLSTPLWPNPDSLSNKFTPVWLGMTNRHFGVAMHTLFDPAPASGVMLDKPLRLAATVDRYVMDSSIKDAETMVVFLKSEPVTVAPGQAGRFDAAIYAGPLSQSFLTEKAEPRAAAVNLTNIVIYTLGGPCGFCTFQPVAHLLRWWLAVLHDNLVFDYSLSIILLVVCVRTILHPVTKWSQVSMLRFSKQMAAIGPKQKKLQEKYKGDPAKMREEMAKLMREENVSYTGLLGCIPSFMQSPIWIALYAMLYFMFELRHTPGFFGVFQWLSMQIAGQKWTFLADLSEPDSFIPLGFAVEIPLIGLVDSINILPVLLGFIFYVQQKYLTPPPTTQLTPEQEQQQKIMKIMMVVLFPLMMYNTPSALVLYFIANSTLGIFESRYIRRHVDLKELQRKDEIIARGGSTVIDRKNPKQKPGFFQRLQQLAEERAKQMEAMKKQPPSRKK
ncbi:MAG: YidC/Oxa1 family insertase periplasmic-domain containing protein [Pyrinomonadaceae bacterium]|nr:YidC/Oxa1 family insertase periplasmic-domain containing protein [Phycisphaerales bacterium]